MKDKTWVLTKYMDVRDFLERQDKNGITEQEVYDQAVVKYELLHDILEFKGEKKWCS